MIHNSNLCLYFITFIGISYIDSGMSVSGGCCAREEKNAGKDDTAGFKRCDDDAVEMNVINGIRRLRLRREDRGDLHMKSSSVTQLHSWRANVDTQILMFKCDPTDPKNFDYNNLMHVTRYVTSYACKGSEKNFDYNNLMQEVD